MRLLITADPGLPVPPPLYGGIERVIDGLVRQLVSRGHDVTLLADTLSTSPATRRWPWPKTSPHTLLGQISHMGMLARAVRECRPDLVHSFSRLWFLLPALLAKIPSVMSYQREPTLAAVRRAVRVSRGSLAFSGCSAYICRQGGRAGGTWTAIPNGIPLSQYEFRARVSHDAPLLFLSRVERIKGAHTAIQVARRSGRRLVIAGNHSETGDEGRYWREVIAPEVGRGGVEYIGAVNDEQKNEWLGKAAALLVPVEWEEPFGIVFAEALACGTPVISSPRGALPEIVRPGIDGFLEGSIEGLCKAVSEVHTIDRAQCRRRAEEYFSIDVVADQYEALYRRWIKR